MPAILPCEEPNQLHSPIMPIVVYTAVSLAGVGVLQPAPGVTCPVAGLDV